MNKDQVEGSWDEFKGKAQKLWGKLTDDDFDRAKGSMESMMGTIQTKFGDTKEDIKRKLSELKSHLP